MTRRASKNPYPDDRHYEWPLEGWPVNNALQLLARLVAIRAGNFKGNTQHFWFGVAEGASAMAEVLRPQTFMAEKGLVATSPGRMSEAMRHVREEILKMQDAELVMRALAGHGLPKLLTARTFGVEHLGKPYGPDESEADETE